MARFLIGTIPVVGHVSPGVAIAQGLIARGHEVWWYTGRSFQQMVEATGARFVPITRWLDYSYPENIPQELTDQRNRLQGPAQLKFDLKHFFIDVAIGQVQDLEAILQEFPADVVVTDSFFLGAGWVHERGGPPHATFGISALGFSSRDTAPFGLGLKPDSSLLGQGRNQFLNWLMRQVLLRDVTTYTNQLRATLGLPPSPLPFFENLSPYLYLVGTVPSFEYPRRDLPAQVHFVGPLQTTSSKVWERPGWWSELEGDRPVILVTKGTIATDLKDLLIPALGALAEEEVLVLGITGGEKPENLNLAIPRNARVETFIPYAQVLPYVDVMVTNGGFNGVQTALSYGVPLVTAGRTEDKPEVCAHVEWTGAGINLRTKSPRPEKIREAVRRVLGDARYKARAKAFQTEMSQYHSAELSAQLLEQLAGTQTAVLRNPLG